MEKINVFGASGFVGTWFCYHYAHDIVIQDRDDNVPQTNNILFLISTVDNYNVFKDIYVDVQTNLIKTLQVLDAAYQKYGKDFTITFVSTWFVYGTPNYLPVDEKHPCNPNGFYPITRLAGEGLVHSFCDTMGCKYKIIRLSNILGVGDRKASLKKNAIVHFLQELGKGHTIQIYNEPSIRDLLDVRDAVSGIYKVLENGKVGEIYNIGSGKPTDVKQLLEHAEQITNNKLISYMDVPDFHKAVQTKDFYFDISKIRDLGWKPQIPLESTVAWIMNHYEE